MLSRSPEFMTCDEYTLIAYPCLNYKVSQLLWILARNRFGQLGAGLTGGFGSLPLPFSMTSVERRAFNEHVLQRLLAHLAGGGHLAEHSPAYETFFNDGLILPISPKNCPNY